MEVLAGEQDLVTTAVSSIFLEDIRVLTQCSLNPIVYLLLIFPKCTGTRDYNANTID